MASNGKLTDYKGIGNFASNVLDIKFNWFRVRTVKISPIYYSPRWGDKNLRSYIKGRNLTRGGLLHPRIAAAKSHVFASPMDPVSMGEGSQESMKEGAKGRPSPMMPAAGRELPAPPPPCVSCCPLHRLYLHLHHQLLLVYNGSSSHTSLYRPI
jgi:hypothetical protein